MTNFKLPECISAIRIGCHADCEYDEFGEQAPITWECVCGWRLRLAYLVADPTTEEWDVYSQSWVYDYHYVDATQERKDEFLAKHANCVNITEGPDGEYEYAQGRLALAYMLTLFGSIGDTDFVNAELDDLGTCGHAPALDCGCWLHGGVWYRHAFRFLPDDKVRHNTWKGFTGTVIRGGVGSSLYVKWDEIPGMGATPSAFPANFEITHEEV
jgi:hypothetical protein